MLRPRGTPTQQLDRRSTPNFLCTAASQRATMSSMLIVRSTQEGSGSATKDGAPEVSQWVGGHPRKGACRCLDWEQPQSRLSRQRGGRRIIFLLVCPSDTRRSCNDGLFGRVAEIMGRSEQYMCVHTCGRACGGKYVRRRAAQLRLVTIFNAFAPRLSLGKERC